MVDRYFGKVVRVSDEYSVVVNVGDNHNVKLGQRFLLIGIGETIMDPDTGETLEQLEIVRGKVSVTHVQEKISTLTSCEVERDRDTKETRRQSPNTLTALTKMFGDGESVTEVTKLGVERIKPLSNPQPGDFIIKL